MPPINEGSRPNSEEENNYQTEQAKEALPSSITLFNPAVVSSPITSDDDSFYHSFNSQRYFLMGTKVSHYVID